MPKRLGRAELSGLARVSERPAIAGLARTNALHSRSALCCATARLSRIVIPDIPHHATQRLNRRQKLFTERGDYALYRDLLAERCERNGVSCWAYCLLPR